MGGIENRESIYKTAGVCSMNEKKITHLACIMDGNRRWAKQHGWLPWDGHRAGLKTAQRVVDFCLEQSISYLSLYTFSLENFRRPPQELNFLFNVLMKEMKEALLKKFIAKGVRVTFVGDRSLFPKAVLPICDEIEEKTKEFSVLQVNLLFCYGGQQELVHGMKVIAQKLKSGELSEDDISDELLEQSLWTAGIPAPDLIVRTGGIKRLSNFFLFKAAYSEFFFLDCFWPELTHIHLNEVVESFHTRQRNFGL
ncbi:di-trans,poly-cis-decaprenylcistransferase [Candidatus Dependentiae bacterium]|nr:MAG: di-trans,poly-cis-decaprenylcistransferase [Candidatus Dependentiae bacterium]